MKDWSKEKEKNLWNGTRSTSGVLIVIWNTDVV